MLELSNGTFESFVHFVIFASFSILLGVIVVVRHAAARLTCGMLKIISGASLILNVLN